MNGLNLSKPRVAWPPQGWLGLVLLALCWPLNWTLPGMRTAYLFFPLWLGYILVMDALVQGRAGTSLWTRSRRDFVLLFVASTPVWWLFELINYWLGRRHFLQDLQHGDWRPVLSRSLGAVTCGFFWEMWNYYSYPKWIYHTPGAQFFHIFEMPLLGYGGYIPFALELCALKNLLWPRSAGLRF